MSGAGSSKSLPFVDLTPLCDDQSFPKIGNAKMLEFWNAWEKLPDRIGDFLTADGKNTLVVPRTAGYYVSAYPTNYSAQSKWYCASQTVILATLRF